MNKKILSWLLCVFIGSISAPSHAEVVNPSVEQSVSRKPSLADFQQARARASMRAHLCSNQTTGSAIWVGKRFGESRGPQIMLELDPTVVPIYGYLDPSDVGGERHDLGETVSQIQDQIYIAYKQALVRNPHLAGQVIYPLGIRTEGVLSPPTYMASSELHDPQFESQLLQLINTMHFTSGCFTEWHGKFVLNFYPKT